jgi:hypothetical protein
LKGVTVISLEIDESDSPLRLDCFNVLIKNAITFYISKNWEKIYTTNKIELPLSFTVEYSIYLNKDMEKFCAILNNDGTYTCYFANLNKPFEIKEIYVDILEWVGYGFYEDEDFFISFMENIKTFTSDFDQTET